MQSIEHSSLSTALVVRFGEIWRFHLVFFFFFFYLYLQVETIAKTYAEPQKEWNGYRDRQKIRDPNYGKKKIEYCKSRLISAVAKLLQKREQGRIHDSTYGKKMS